MARQADGDLPSGGPPGGDGPEVDAPTQAGGSPARVPLPAAGSAGVALGSATERVRSAVAALPPPPDAAPVHEDLYLLFSFDLTNSTEYKEREPQDWPLVTARFYELVLNGMQGRVHADVRLWKYVGDEVLLYWRVTHVGQLRDAVEAAYGVLLDTIQRLHDNFPRTRTVLSVKGVAWAARARQIQPELIAAAARGEGPAAPLNLVFDAAPGRLGASRDFLGPDIDKGFRLAHHARKRRLVVGADLAYLLYRDRARTDAVPGTRPPKIESVLRIVGFEPLRGVWENRPYPILWYEADWARVASTFEYDEPLKSPLVKRLSDDGDRATRGLDELEKVFTDVDRLTVANRLWEFVQALRPADDEDAVAGATASRLGPEVHCAAVCFDPASGRVLVAQRPAHKRHLPNAWEFGCGQLGPGETVEAALQRSYHEDFGAELAFGPGAPRPITTYYIERGAGRVTTGLLFVAAVRNRDAIERKRHQAIAWVDPGDRATWPSAPWVPDFAETLRRAAAVWAEAEGAITAGPSAPGTRGRAA